MFRNIQNAIITPRMILIHKADSDVPARGRSRKILINSEIKPYIKNGIDIIIKGFNSKAACKLPWNS
jgi:hypothetical protein